LNSQAGSIGLGFAIPINQARKTADQLITIGKASYPVMGVSIDMNFAGPGAKVTTADGAILPGGPAQKAGIKPGDLIIEFGGKAINNPDELIVAIRARSIGDRVEVKYKRGSSTRSATVTLTAGKN
jgi:putative serine protease PepD